MNKQVSQLLDVDEFDYIRWCRANKRAIYKKALRKEFLEKVQSGKLERDTRGHLTKTYRKKDINEA